MKTPKINTKKGFNIVFNKYIDSYGNMIEISQFYFKDELFYLSSTGWDLPTIYKNKECSKVIEIYPRFLKDNKRLFKEVIIQDFTY